jgi:hypothetical protein
MATNSSNSNSVNIAGLPTAQIATNTDLFILETQNGTQTIQFQDLNVVKTDATGNATVVGNITGTNAFFSNVETTTLRADQIYSNDQLADSKSFGYYNRFQVTNGIIISSDYTTGSPEYITLLNLYKTLSANSSQNYKKVYEYNGVAVIPATAPVSPLLNIGGFPVNSSGTSIGNSIGNSASYASYFTLTPFHDGNVSYSASYWTPVLSAFKYYPGTGSGDDYMTFCVGQSAVNNQNALRIGVRLLYFYN